jgi:hypothetical protein
MRTLSTFLVGFRAGRELNRRPVRFHRNGQATIFRRQVHLHPIEWVVLHPNSEGSELIGLSNECSITSPIQSASLKTSIVVTPVDWEVHAVAPVTIGTPLSPHTCQYTVIRRIRDLNTA